MKKLFLFLTVAAAALASCTKEYLVENTDAPKSNIIFQGELPATKIALGEKEGNIYKTVWETGDALKVLKASDKTELATITLSEGAGTSNGTFTVTSGNLTAGEEVILVYGEATIPAVQTQAAAGQFDLITSAKSQELTLIEDAPVKFSLSHEVALVKVEVSSAEFAGLELTSVMLLKKPNTLPSLLNCWAKCSPPAPKRICGCVWKPKPVPAPASSISPSVPRNSAMTPSTTPSTK